MERADVTVDNTGSLAAFHEEIARLLGVETPGLTPELETS
ncbi:MAG: hypothetical protein J07HB67_02460 [halophilic archaeon J07HB67]|jgi:hypothetical protein|nr:MAG: hypothetical protein J07HB67_02460 [halophilic archaeon J07HB67]